MNPQPSVSVLYPTLNGGDQFEASLRQVQAQEYTGAVEILVCDSGSSDRTPERAEALGATVWRIPNSEFDHGRTRNQLASRANNDVLIFMVQDAEPADPQWMSALVEAVERPGIAAAFSRQSPRSWSREGNAAFLRAVYGDEPVERTKSWTGRPPILDEIFFSNVGSATARSTWQSFQFAEGLTMSEDQDFAKRILDAGMATRYEPRAELLHDNGHGWLATFKRNALSANSLENICELGIRGGKATDRLKRTIRGSAGITGKLDTLWLETARVAGFAAGRVRSLRA